MVFTGIQSLIMLCVKPTELLKKCFQTLVMPHLFYFNNPSSKVNWCIIYSQSENLRTNSFFNSSVGRAVVSHTKDSQIKSHWTQILYSLTFSLVTWKNVWCQYFADFVLLRTHSTVISILLNDTHLIIYSECFQKSTVFKNPYCAYHHLIRR